MLSSLLLLTQYVVLAVEHAGLLPMSIDLDNINLTDLDNLLGILTAPERVYIHS